MAKDPFDMPEFDKPDSDFDDFDFDVETLDTDNNRRPSERSPSKLAGVFKGAAKSTVANLGPKVAQKLTSEMHHANHFVGDVFNVASDVTRLKDNFMRDVTPTINQLQRVGRQLAPKIKPFVPERLYNRIEKGLSRDDYAPNSLSLEESRTASIASSLDSLFSREQEARKEDQKEERVERFVDRALGSSRHKELAQLVDDIRGATLFQQEFAKTTTTAFYRRNLELKYRHLFVAQDTLAAMQLMAKMTEEKLDQIRHNTALPDIQKATKLETYKEVALGNMANRMNQVISGWGGQIVKNVQAKVFEPLKAGLENAAMAGDMLSMMSEMEDAMAEVGGGAAPTSPFERVGGMIGHGIAGLAGTKLGKKAMDLISPYAANLDEMSSGMKTKLLLKVKELEDQRGGDGSPLGWLIDLISPGLNRGPGEMKNTLADPTAPAPFDIATRQSIVEIIPGYLAKILQQTTRIATGRDAEELVYDMNRRDFVGTSQFKADMSNRLFGSSKERGESLGKAIGALRGSYAHHGHDDFASFDELNDEISIFLNNHALKKYDVKPEEIRQVAEGAGIDYSEYTTAVFAKVEHPEQVATQLVNALYRDYETINKQALQQVNHYVFSLMDKDEYLQQMPVLANAMGYARHLNHLFESRGDRMEFIQDAIQAEQTKVDRGSLADAAYDQSVRTKRRLDDDLKAKLESDPTIAEVGERLTGNAKRTSLNTNELPTVRSGQYGGGRAGGGPVRKGKVYLTGEHGPELVEMPEDGFVHDAKTTQQFIRKGKGKNKDLVAVAIERSIPIPLESGGGKGTTQLKQKAGADGESTSVVSALTEFKSAFDDYATKQVQIPDQLQQTNNLLVELVQETRNGVWASMQQMGGSFLGRASGLIGRGIKGYGKALRTGLDVSKWGIEQGVGLVKAGLPVAGDLAKFGVSTALGTAKWGGEQLVGLSQGLMQAILGGGTGPASLGKTALGVPSAALGTVLGWGKGIPGIGKHLKRAGDHLKGLRFVDIYVKDKVDPGKTIVLSKRKQEEGVVFASGKAVTTSFTIDEPVLDPETKQTLITKEDIEQGLVDVENKPLSRFGAGGLMSSAQRAGDAALGMIGGGIKGLGKGLLKVGGSLLSGINPLMGIYSQMLGLGMKGIGAIGKGASKLIGRLFGFGDSGGIGTKDLKKLVGDKLDKIYELLDKRLKKRDADDSDGDGDRDNSVADQLQRKKDKADKQTKKKETMGPEEEKKKGLLASLKDKLAKKDQDGGWLDTVKDWLPSIGGGVGGLAGLGSLLGLGTGGAAAATAATTATAATATAATTAAATTTAAGVTGMAGTVAAGASTIPVAGWVVAGAIVAGLGAYGAYKYFGRSDAETSLLEMRADAYGIKLDTPTGWFQQSMSSQVEALEKATLEIMTNKAKPMSDSDLESWADRFGLDNSDKEQVEYWATWYRQRFVPAFRIYNELLGNLKVDYYHADSLAPEQVDLLKRVFIQSTASHVAELRELVPTLEAFKKFKKSMAEDEEARANDPGSTRPRDYEDAEPDEATHDQFTSRSKTYNPKSNFSASAKRFTENEDRRQGSFYQRPAAAPMTQPSTSATPGATAQGSAGSGPKVQIPGSDDLGALSAKYESGRKGSDAIGYDAVGGTSYGKYQIASAGGTFNNFLKWLGSKGQVGQEIADRLMRAGRPNTMSTTGPVPEEWRKIVAEGKMGNFEHDFIKETHFDPALRGISDPQLLELIKGSKALQDVLWSTAVQHGPGGASRIFNACYKQGMSAQEFLKAVYDKRGTQFGSSSAGVQASVRNRFSEEFQIASAMLDKEGKQPGGQAGPMVASAEGTPSSGGDAPPPSTTSPAATTAPGATPGAPPTPGATGGNTAVPGLTGASSAPAGASAPATAPVATADAAMATVSATSAGATTVPAEPAALTPPPDKSLAELKAEMQTNNQLLNAILEVLKGGFTDLAAAQSQTQSAQTDTTGKTQVAAASPTTPTSLPGAKPPSSPAGVNVLKTARTVFGGGV